MKEVKDFIEMMEWNDFGDGDAIITTPEYEALKALVDKPVSKMEVTEGMVDAALEAYFPRADHFPDFDYEGEILNDEMVRPSMKAALEAVFASITSGRKE